MVSFSHTSSAHPNRLRQFGLRRNEEKQIWVGHFEEPAGLGVREMRMGWRRFFELVSLRHSGPVRRSVPDLRAARAPISRWRPKE